MRFYRAAQIARANKRRLTMFGYGGMGGGMAWRGLD